MADLCCLTKPRKDIHLFTSSILSYGGVSSDIKFHMLHVYFLRTFPDNMFVIR